MKKALAYMSLVLITGLFTSGCGSSLQVVKPVEQGIIPEGTPRTFDTVSIQAKEEADIPDEIMSMVDLNVRGQLREAGIQTKPGNLSVEVEVTGYRKRGTFVRVFWGVFAGSDWVEASVQVKDSKSQKVLGEATIRGSNASTVDFGIVTTLLGGEIAKYLKGL